MKKLITLLMATIMMFALATSAWAADTWDGLSNTDWYTTNADATSFEISTAEQLAGLASLVNGGNDFSGKTITLTDDLDLNSREWTPIGTAKKTKAVTDETVFAGTFIATDYIISNLSITSGGEDDGLGLFGGVNGTVQNVTLTNVSIDVSAADTIGAVAGFLCEGGSVTGCTVGTTTDNSTISATEAGGVVGRIMAEGSITNCTNYATVTGSYNAGGIANKAYYGATGTGMTISGCINYGEITATGYHAGGIVAFSAATITNCTNNGVILTNGNTAGGIVGEQTTHGNVTGCVNTAKVTGNSNAGGIVGWVRYQNSSSYPSPVVIEISNNENTADVNTLAGGDSNLGTGGIVGSIYNAAIVTGNTCEDITIIGKTFASGIVGNLQENSGNYFYNDGQNTITVTGNTVSDVKIYGVCKAEVAYDNTVGSFTVENNTVSNVTLANLVTTEAELTTAVDEATAGDLIVLGADITLTATITPKVNITIDGQGEYAISGGGAKNFTGITLTGDVDLTLKNLTMKEFESYGKGCVLASSTSNYDGTVTITNCNFSDFGKYAVCLYYGTLIMDNCTMDGTVPAGHAANRTGNLVQVSGGGTAYITNCDFKNSVSTSYSEGVNTVNTDEAIGIYFNTGAMPTSITGNTFENCNVSIYFDDYWDGYLYWSDTNSYPSDELLAQLLEDNNFTAGDNTYNKIWTTAIEDGTAYIFSGSSIKFEHPTFDGDVLCYYKVDNNEYTDRAENLADCFTTLEDAITAERFTNYVIAPKETATISDSVVLLADATLTIMEGATFTIPSTLTLTNNGAIVNDGTIENNGTIISDTEIEGTVTGTVATIGYNQYSTLAAAVAASESGDSIVVFADIELTADITISNDVTITGATGTETITTPASNKNFELAAGTDVTFTNLVFDVTYNIISTNSSNTGSSITFDDCEFDIGGTNSSYIVYGSTGSETDVTIKNSTIGGDIRKAVLVYLSGDSVFTFTGNEVTDEAPNENGSVATVVMQSETAKVTITGNTFTDLYRGFCIDKSTATGSWTITGNKFINVDYALNYDSNIDYNNVSMAYNFNSATADGEGTFVALLDEATEGTGTSVVTLYPYYADSDLTKLVYLSEEGVAEEKTVEEATTEALENALSAEATTEEIADAVTLVEILDNETILENDDLLEMVYSLDEALLENGSLEAGVSIITLSDEDAATAADAVESVSAADLQVSEDADANVQGLAVAIIGNEEIAEDTTVTVTLEITQKAASVSQDAETEAISASITYEISPSKTVDDGTNPATTTTVENKDISAPITFTLHLPSIFDTTNRATVTHKDGDDIYSTDTYVVYHDGTDNYITVTTTHFSEFVVELADSVSTGSSVKKYSNSLEVGDNGSAYATPLSASSGTTVYINVSPDAGYEVDEVLVDGGDITVTDNEDGTYSYKQPAYAVEIEVTFQADGTVDVEEEVVEESDEALTAFEDVVAGAWYEEYIAAAVEEGIMQGNSETEFAPNGTTTRAMMIQVLFNMSDEPETENDEAAWYSEALAWGMEFGITDGTEITGNLTREQLVTMLYRYAMSNGVDTSAAGDLTTYNDAENVADWAADAFAWACGEGIINGDTAGNLNPDGNATRAELAKIMVSYLAL